MTGKDPLDAVVDALILGGAVLVGVPHYEQARYPVSRIMSAAIEAGLVPQLQKSTMRIDTRTGGFVRVLLEASPDSARGYRAQLVWLPCGAGPAFQRALELCAMPDGKVVQGYDAG